MQLHFEPVCMQNRKAIEKLQIFPAQVGLIESVRECLREADETSVWRPIGIYDGQTLIGFAMYGYFASPQPGRLWLDRFLIDKSYQGNGYGEAAVRALLQKLQKAYDCGEVYLSVYADNTAAIALYRKIGFHFNGEYDTNGEKVMMYAFRRVSTRK